MRPARWLGVLGVMGALALPAIAHADVLVMEEPLSGLQLEVPDACQVKPAIDGSAACASYAASAYEAERFAVVLHDGGLLAYSIAFFRQVESGTGEERARRIGKNFGESVSSTPTVVSFGEQSFLRAELRVANGAALCFVTIDTGQDVAIIMFASEPGAASAMMTHADEAMQSVRRTAGVAAPPPPPTPPMSVTTQAIITLFVALVFGLPMVRAINQHLARNRKKRQKRGAS